MRTFTIVLIVLLFAACTKPVKVIPLDKKDIPASIKYTGHIINSVSYTDNDGKHIVLTTETGTVDTTLREIVGMKFQKADVYAYNYILANDKPHLSWQMHDLTGACPLDTKGYFVPGTFAITDLNKNGIAEVWLMYLTGCRGDPVPGSLKIIMHEGPKKYAVRGTSRVKLPPLPTTGGEYKFDNAFNHGPDIFRRYALDLWKKNMNEN